MNTKTPYTFNKTARKSLVIYLMTLMGFIFVTSLLTMDRTTACPTEDSCPLWLHATALIVGALFFIGGLMALILNTECGSKLDPERGKISWWFAYPSVKREEIDAAKIKKIIVDTSSDSDRVYLVTDKNKKIPIETCIPRPYEKWAERAKEAFSHIEIEILK